MTEVEPARHPGMQGVKDYVISALWSVTMLLMRRAMKQTESRKVIYDTVSIHARYGYAVYQIQSLAPWRPDPQR